MNPSCCAWYKRWNKTWLCFSPHRAWITKTIVLGSHSPRLCCPRMDRQGRNHPRYPAHHPRSDAGLYASSCWVWRDLDAEIITGDDDNDWLIDYSLVGWVDGGWWMITMENQWLMMTMTMAITILKCISKASRKLWLGIGTLFCTLFPNNWLCKMRSLKLLDKIWWVKIQSTEKEMINLSYK